MTDDRSLVTEDRLLGGRLVVRQPAHGHRAGTDAVLLAAAAGPMPGDRIVDLGSGVGTVGLALALAAPLAFVHLVEREDDLVTLARTNIGRNDLVGRVTIEASDLMTAPGPRNATLVVSNPPFYPEGTVRVSPNPLRARAHALGASGHAGWLHAMLGWCTAHARVVMIHKPEALPPLLAACEGRVGGIRVRPIQPRADAAATRMLFGGIVGSRAPFALSPALVLHEASGQFTAEAAAMHRGDGSAALLNLHAQKSRP